MVLIVCCYTLENEDPMTGKSSTLLIDGQIVYFGVVTLVNIKILTSTSNFTIYTFFFTIGSILSFVLAYYLLSLFQSQYLFSLFFFPFKHLVTYISLFFVGTALVLVDNGLHLAQHEIKVFIDSRESERSKHLAYLISQDHAI